MPTVEYIRAFVHVVESVTHSTNEDQIVYLDSENLEYFGKRSIFSLEDLNEYFLDVVAFFAKQNTPENQNFIFVHHNGTNYVECLQEDATAVISMISQYE